MSQEQTSTSQEQEPQEQKPTTKDQAGFKLGKPSSYTPKKRDKWIHEFNDLLKESECSRNELMTELLQIGLQSKRHNTINVPIDGLSSDQIELIHTPQGQQILNNIIKMMLGEAGGFSQLTVSQPNGKELSKSTTSTQEFNTNSFSNIPEPIQPKEPKETKINIGTKTSAKDKAKEFYSRTKLSNSN